MFDSYQAFKAWLLTQFNTKVKRLRSDHGGEYLSVKFTKYLESKGTERRVTVHDTPEHNGVAERLNWTLVKWVRTMMHTSGMPKSLWGEAVMHATWVKNCTSMHQLSNDGHQIYFPDHGNIGIERSIAFKQRDTSAPP